MNVSTIYIKKITLTIISLVLFSCHNASEKLMQSQPTPSSEYAYSDSSDTSDNSFYLNNRNSIFSDNDNYELELTLEDFIKEKFNDEDETLEKEENIDDCYELPPTYIQEGNCSETPTIEENLLQQSSCEPTDNGIYNEQQTYILEPKDYYEKLLARCQHINDTCKKYLLTMMIYTLGGINIIYESDNTLSAAFDIIWLPTFSLLQPYLSFNNNYHISPSINLEIEDGINVNHLDSEMVFNTPREIVSNMQALNILLDNSNEELIRVKTINEDLNQEVAQLKSQIEHFKKVNIHRNNPLGKIPNDYVYITKTVSSGEISRELQNKSTPFYLSLLKYRFFKFFNGDE